MEREFHISLFENIIKYIKDHDLGEIGILSSSYVPSTQGKASVGARLHIVQSIAGNDFIPVNTPAEYDPDITFFADVPSEYDGHLGIKVCIGHGTICKGSFYIDSSKIRRDNYADLICVPGTIHREVLQKNIFKPIEVTGIPKLDSLFSGILERDEILNNLGLNPDNRTILFAPTYNYEFSLLPWLKGDFRDYFPDYINVIIKLHGVEKEETKEYYRKLASISVGISYSENHNIVECFQAADLLVSDVSSVVYEFAATGKPVLLFDSPCQKEHPKFNEKDLEYMFRDIGIRFKEPNELKHLILQSLILPESNDRIAENFVSIRDGSSSEKVVQYAVQLCESGVEKPILYITGSTNGNHQKLVGRYNKDFRIKIINEVYDVNFSSVNNNICVLNGNYNYSPMFPSFLGNHHVYEKAELIIPMVSRHFEVPGQDVVLFHPQANGVPDNRAGEPIVATTPGESVNYDSDFIPLAFSYTGGDSEIIAYVLNACLQEKIVSVTKESVRIAKDCFVY